MAERLLTCTWCGSDIERPRSNKSYCSASCRAARLRSSAAVDGRSQQWYQTSLERKRRPVVTSPCVVCGKGFQHKRDDAKFCSRVCSAKASYEARRDSPEFKAGRARYKKNPGAVAYARKRQAQRRGVYAEAFTPQEIFERDGYRCHLCRRKCDRRKTFPHGKSPTLDHIVPLARQGEHTRANVATACLSCNARKQHHGGGEQLAVI